MPPTSVFVSYSHDSDEHAARVLVLANRLRAEGVDCHLDQYEESPPEGWARWGERQLRECNYVLVVCTRTYAERAEGRAPSGEGRGATWEGAPAAGGPSP